MIETKFKDSELGKIPDDWEYGCFKDFLTYFSSGATPYRGNPFNFVGNIPWISSGELNYNIITETNEHISINALKSTHLTLHEIGTFLIAITGLEAAGTRGRCAFVGVPAATNQSCLAIKSTDKLSTRYLFWYYRLWSDYLAFNFSQGSKQQSFTAEIVKKLPLYAPTIDEQERIAEALSDVDALIKELDVLIEKKRMVLKAAMQDLLTARRRLPGFSEPWQEVKLGNIGVLIRGVSFNPEQCYITQISNTIPILRSNNIQLDQINLSSLIYVDKNCVNHNQYILNEDILICSANGSERLVGKSAFIDSLNGFSFGAFMMVFRCFNTCVSKYISLYMRIDSYKLQIKDLLCGSAINNLNASQLYSIKISLPTSLSEQQAIAEILSDMDSEIAELEKKKKKYTSIRQGMMQQLLTGKIRLI